MSMIRSHILVCTGTGCSSSWVFLLLLLALNRLSYFSSDYKKNHIV